MEKRGGGISEKELDALYKKKEFLAVYEKILPMMNKAPADRGEEEKEEAARLLMPFMQKLSYYYSKFTPDIHQREYFSYMNRNVGKILVGTAFTASSAENLNHFFSTVFTRSRNEVYTKWRRKKLRQENYISIDDDANPDVPPLLDRLASDAPTPCEEIIAHEPRYKDEDYPKLGEAFLEKFGPKLSPRQFQVISTAIRNPYTSHHDNARHLGMTPINYFTTRIQAGDKLGEKAVRRWVEREQEKGPKPETHSPGRN